MSDKNPVVSVLIPSFNAERYLTPAIESALAQTYTNVEIIVVDDGSTDGSLDIARSFASNGVRIIAQDNGGQAAALNTAYAAARGDYFQYLDADDILHPQKIAVQVERLSSAEPMTMASGAWARFTSDIGEAVFTPEKVWQDLSPIDWLVESWSGGGMMHVAAWLIPRVVVETAGSWPEPLRWAANLDSHFFTRALLASSECLFCPGAMSYYRSGHASMSSWRSRKSLEATLRVTLENGDALVRRQDSARTRAKFADMLQRFVYSTYPDSRDLVGMAEARIRELGGSGLPPSGGPLTRKIAKVCGWKAAKRLRRVAGVLS